MRLRIYPVIKWGCFAPICAFFALFVGVWLLDVFMPTVVMRALPDSATEVKEDQDTLNHCAC